MCQLNDRNEDDLLEDMAALELESGGGQKATEMVETPEPVQQPVGKKKTVCQTSLFIPCTDLILVSCRAESKR